MYKTFSVKLENRALTVHKGLFVRREKLLRLDMAQSVKIFSTPTMRIFGLYMLIVAFEGSVMILPPMDKIFARKIYDTARNPL